MSHSTTEPLANYVRVHRKKAGLSQSELGILLGYRDADAIGRQECFHSLPPLLIAIGYEVIFQEPLTEIFAGLRLVVEQTVEKRLAEFETALRSAEVLGNHRKVHARKLEWLEGRRRTLK